MADGRMIKREIAKSKKMARLNDDRARTLYFMIYPHVDVEGRYTGDPGDVKAMCIPLFDWSLAVVEECLIALHNVGLIVLYDVNGEWYLQITRFHDFNRVDKTRETRSKIPSPTGRCVGEIRSSLAKMDRGSMSKEVKRSKEVSIAGNSLMETAKQNPELKKMLDNLGITLAKTKRKKSN